MTYHLIKAETFNVLLCFLNTWPLKKGFIYLDKNVFEQTTWPAPALYYFKASSCKSAPLYVTYQSQHYQCVVTYWGGEVKNREEGEMAWKSREEGESEMLWERGDIDEKVILGVFLTCMMTIRDGGMWNLTYTVIPLGLLWLPWLDLTEKAWNQTWHLRLPGLKIGDGQHTTHALGCNLTFRASL